MEIPWPEPVAASKKQFGKCLKCIPSKTQKRASSFLQLKLSQMAAAIKEDEDTDPLDVCMITEDWVKVSTRTHTANP